MIPRRDGLAPSSSQRPINGIPFYETACRLCVLYDFLEQHINRSQVIRASAPYKQKRSATMRYLSRLSPVLFLFLFMLLSTTARADVVTVTGGSFVPGSAGAGPFNFIGQGFNVSGGTGLPGGSAGLSCFGCQAGSLVTFGHRFIGSDFSAGVGTVNGVSYQQLFFAGDIQFAGSFLLPAGGTSFTLTIPFTLSGTLNGYLSSPSAGNPPAIFSMTLQGQGLATLQLFSVETANSTRYFLSGIRYDFQDPTATPEPATLLLLGTGLAGLAARRRARRNKTTP